MSELSTQGEPTLRQSVAEEIRALMARRNVSRLKVAKALGVSHTTVWRRLSGDIPLDLDELERIAAVIGVEVSELMPAPREGKLLTAGGASRERTGHVSVQKVAPTEQPRPNGHPKRAVTHPGIRRPARIGLAAA